MVERDYCCETITASSLNPLAKTEGNKGGYLGEYSSILIVKGTVA